MGFFDIFRGHDINQGVEEYRSTPDVVLLDVRTVDEYRSGHIAGSMNIPLGNLNQVTGKVNDKDTPIFVHCFSGARSRQAETQLARLGYTNVKNIGGISAWRGRVEK